MRMPQSASGPGAPGSAGADAGLDAAGAHPAATTPGAPPSGTAAPRPGHPRYALRRPGPAEFARLARRSGALARGHWLATILLAIGLVLRVLVQIAYSPAIIYIDSLKYVYNAWPGADPVAYKIPLRVILSVGDLSTVALAQHLLGMAMAVTLYAVLIRRGAARWLGALAMAPVLLDGYQLQAEQMIMPDVWFEALIVAGLAVMLWRPRPSTRMIVIGSLLFGAACGVRQVGEILIIPALIFAVVTCAGEWRQRIWRGLAAGLAFGIAVMAYMGVYGMMTGHYYLSRSSSTLTYGRMAAAADCATLKLPPVARPLCPTPAQRATMGPDDLEHAANGTLKVYEAQYNRKYPSAGFQQVIDDFNRAVETQQPLRVIQAVAADSLKLFAITRYTSPGDTPIWRWQFQTSFPVYPPYVQVQHGRLIFSYSRATSPTGEPLAQNYQPLDPSMGAQPQVNVPVASFLRAYQLGGGYTPGPLLLLFVLVGLIGSALLLASRGLTSDTRLLAQATLLTFLTAALVLGASDAFEFTWRYQLPAVVTLPPAGALGIAAMFAIARRSSERGEENERPPRVPEMAAPPA